MRVFKNKPIFIILQAVCLLFLTSCSTSTTIDLINKDTERFYSENNFYDPILSQYKVDEVLFIPYITRNPHQSYDDKYTTYDLRLEVYKKADSNSDISINSISIEKANDVNFVEVKEELNKLLKFYNYEKNNSLKVSEIQLLEKINTYDMELNERSKMNVRLNINIKKDSQTINKDLLYIFETDINKYLIQR